MFDRLAMLGSIIHSQMQTAEDSVAVALVLALMARIIYALRIPSAKR